MPEIAVASPRISPEPGPTSQLRYSGPMHRSWSLSAKLGAIGCTLLLMALASIGLTLWVTWQLEGGGAAVNEAGRMRMQTWRLAQMLPDADPKQVEALMAEFDQSVNVLRSASVWPPRSCRQ